MLSEGILEHQEGKKNNWKSKSVGNYISVFFLNF